MLVNFRKKKSASTGCFDFRVAYPCLLGEIRSPLARIDSVDEFNAIADDDTRLRFKEELGLSSSSPSSYLVPKYRYFCIQRSQVPFNCTFTSHTLTISTYRIKLYSITN